MADISLAQGSFTYQENGDAIALDANATLSNFEGLGELGGYVLELSLTGAVESDRLIVTENSSIQLDGRRVLLSDQPDQQIATFTQAYDLNAPLLTLTLSAGMTASQLESLIRSLAYVNVSDALVDGNRTVNLTLKSGQGQEEATAEREFQVTAAEDLPQVLAAQLLFDGETETLASVSQDEPEAAPAGNWLYALDLTEVPYDIPPLFAQLGVGGTEIGGNSTYQIESSGITLTTDNEAYAGLSNYQFDYSELAQLSFPQALGLATGGGDVPIGIAKRNDAFPTLDRSEGYQLSFDLQFLSESLRTSGADKNGDSIDDRAGFSVILLSEDKLGIELGFWGDRIWAQNDGAIEPDVQGGENTDTLFTQGESAAFQFDSNQSVNFELAVQGDRYNLIADGNSILTGQLRDYRSFNFPPQVIPSPLNSSVNLSVNPPNPYDQPSFVFLGDNTPTAGASVKLDNITVETAPASNEPVVSADAFPVLTVQDLDLDEGRSQLTLSVQSGTLDSGTPVNGGVSSEDISGSGTNQLVLTGTREQLNTTLNSGLLSYSGSGSETLSFNVIPEPDTPPPVETSGNLSIFSRNLLTKIEDGVLSTEPIRPFIRDENWQVKAAGQFTGGAESEIFWHNIKTGQVVMWKDINASAVALPAETNRNWGIIGTGQFDNNNNLDLLWYNREEGKVRIWLMEGDSRAADPVDLLIGTTGTNNASPLQDAVLVGSGDFDGDDATDLLWVKDDQILISQIMFNAETGVAGTIATTEALSLPNDLSATTPTGIGDYNNDGRDDLFFSEDNQIWLMNGITAPEVISLSALPA